MLSQIRKASHNIIFKILLIIIVLAFIIWGIGDVFNKDANPDVVTFSKANNISKNEFIQVKESEINRIRKIPNLNLSYEDLDKINIDGIILSKLIREHLLEQLAHEYNLKLSDDIIFEFIKNSNYFHNKEGQFDIEILKNALKNSNMTEKQYFDKLQKHYSQEIILNNFINNYYIPNIFTDDIIRVFAEKRTIQLISVDLLDKKLQSNLLPPTDKQLQEFYNNNKSKFEKPEQRNISYIILDDNYFKNKVIIDNKTLEKYYETHSDQFQERKDFASNISQIKEKYISEQVNILYNNTITLLEDEVASGSNLQEIATKLGIQLTIIDETTKKELINHQVLGKFADNIFSMQEHEISYPIEASTSSLIMVNIHKITPSKVEELNQIQNLVYQEWVKYTIRNKNLILLQDFLQTTDANNFINDAKKINLH